LGFSKRHSRRRAQGGTQLKLGFNPQAMCIRQVILAGQIPAGQKKMRNVMEAFKVMRTTKASPWFIATGQDRL